MKLLRVGAKGQEKPAILDQDGQIRDLSAYVADFAGQGVSFAALDAIRGLDVSKLPVIENPDRIGACLASVPNFYCIGLNYAKHAAEAGLDAPKEPILFSKASTALSGPNDPVIIPRGSQKTDWEVELGVIIGRDALYVSEDEALDMVAGYCIVNDVSERSFQMDRGGQWIKGKSAPTFGPVGPWLVTADEVSNPQALALQLDLNGETLQDSTTADMIFNVRHIISHLSQFMQLQAGDIIATGTPAGVGMGLKPQRFLQAGDVMDLRIEGLGAQRQTVVAAD